MRHVTARLRDTRNGFTADYCHELPDDQSDRLILFGWMEHNDSCDCNRNDYLYGLDADELGCNDPAGPNVIELVSLTVDGVEILPGTSCAR